MTGESSSAISVSGAINRGLNMLVATVLGITALAFGSDLFVEVDDVDKIDNTLLVVIGIVAVAWYLMSNHRFERSTMPLILAGAALLVQIAALPIEAGDPTAIADDIPGMLVFTPLLILIVLTYLSNGRLLAATGGSPPT